MSEGGGLAAVLQRAAAKAAPAVKSDAAASVGSGDGGMPASSPPADDAAVSRDDLVTAIGEFEAASGDAKVDAFLSLLDLARDFPRGE